MSLHEPSIKFAPDNDEKKWYKMIPLHRSAKLLSEDKKEIPYPQTPFLFFKPHCAEWEPANIEKGAGEFSETELHNPVSLPDLKYFDPEANGGIRQLRVGESGEVPLSKDQVSDVELRTRWIPEESHAVISDSFIRTIGQFPSSCVIAIGEKALSMAWNGDLLFVLTQSQLLIFFCSATYGGINGLPELFSCVENNLRQFCSASHLSKCGIDGSDGFFSLISVFSDAKQERYPYVVAASSVCVVFFIIFAGKLVHHTMELPKNRHVQCVDVYGNCLAIGTRCGSVLLYEMNFDDAVVFRKRGSYKVAAEPITQVVISRHFEWKGYITVTCASLMLYFIDIFNEVVVFNRKQTCYSKVIPCGLAPTAYTPMPNIGIGIVTDSGIQQQYGQTGIKWWEEKRQRGSKTGILKENPYGEYIDCCYNENTWHATATDGFQVRDFKSIHLIKTSMRKCRTKGYTVHYATVPGTFPLFNENEQRECVFTFNDRFRYRMLDEANLQIEPQMQSLEKVHHVIAWGTEHESSTTLAVSGTNYVRLVNCLCHMPRMKGNKKK
ncbi:hypothetical protein PCE1_000082 [Barthelona sp. PCE]